jgi:hypothetical protein
MKIEHGTSDELADVIQTRLREIHPTDIHNEKGRQCIISSIHMFLHKQTMNIDKDDVFCFNCEHHNGCKECNNTKRWKFYKKTAMEPIFITKCEELNADNKCEYYEDKEVGFIERLLSGF